MKSNNTSKTDERTRNHKAPRKHFKEVSEILQHGGDEELSNFAFIYQVDKMCLFSNINILFKNVFSKHCMYVVKRQAGDDTVKLVC